MGQVWIFDPQEIALEDSTWWWNPLSYVKDDVKAFKLAVHFASSARADRVVQDAFFEPAGQDLLAAALQHRPITQVFTWLSEPTNQEPVDILRAWDYDLIAADVQGVIMSPEKQRGGVYGTARQMASCLKIRAIEKWVAPVDGNCGRRSPAAVRSGCVRARHGHALLALQGRAGQRRRTGDRAHRGRRRGT